MSGITGKAVSYNLGENILFDRINYGENILILYQNTTNHQQILRNFISQLAQGDALLFYLSHNSHQLDFDFKIRNFNFNVITENVLHELKSQLDQCFKEREEKNKEMCLVSDWSGANLSNCSTFSTFLEELIKKSQGLSPPGWKRKFHQKIQMKNPFLLINAFEISALTEQLMQQLIFLHQRVYLMQENQNTFLLPTLSPSRQTIFPKAHVLPQELLEKVVKDNLELITLLFLERNPQSGYQILKNIAQHFHCILSQGTLYPLLYQLEKNNRIKKQNGRGREVIYSLTPAVKTELHSQKETQLQAYQHLASFFERGGGDKKKLGSFNQK